MDNEYGIVYNKPVDSTEERFTTDFVDDDYKIECGDAKTIIKDNG